MSENTRNRIGFPGAEDIKFSDLYQQSVRPLPKSVYIAIATFGSWDDYQEKNIRAFYDKERAEKYIEKANRVLKAMSKHIKDAFDKTNLDFEEGTSYEAMGMLLEEYEQTDEYKSALNIWGAHSSFQDFNECKIQEIHIQ